jgi:hypothetical protein
MSALIKALARNRADMLFDKYKETKPLRNLDICLRISKEELQMEIMEMLVSILLECENENKCFRERKL